MISFARATIALALILLAAGSAEAFCGFYVAKADTKLFNKASKVVLVWDKGRTVMTMASDYEGDPKEFALVVPVPTFIKREQINVGDSAVVDHLDAYTAPRLVEYFDEDPCAPMPMPEVAMSAAPTDGGSRRGAAALGVTVEATYTVGEYDIAILSAEQSDGLATYLRQEGYRIPDGAEAVLGSYIRQDMRFFVARVNLEEQARLGITFLRPLQVAYQSKKFMLPIRLGTVNANGPQEVFLFALTRNGRVETTNYRTVRIPSDADVPLFVKNDFGAFYKAMFTTAAEREDMRVVFLEYAWDMAWCDPCAADPMSQRELRSLGVFWLPDGEAVDPSMPAQDVFVTRLHVRYDGQRFPEDLMLMETRDRDNFQGRYILRHPWKGQPSCEAGRDYLRSLPARFDAEAQTLARLTGWDIADIRDKMRGDGQSFDPGNIPEGDEDWWDKLWPDD
jgi:hypothetical protein